MDRVDQGTVAALARRHDGVVTHPQLRKLGLSDRAIVRWVSTGRLNRLFPRVYSIGHDLIPTDGWRRAVVHTTGPRSALSHESAIALWKIAPQQRGWHVVVPAGPGPRRSPPTITVHRSRMLSPEDVRTVRGIPVTSVARTLADLACDKPIPKPRRRKPKAEAQVAPEPKGPVMLDPNGFSPGGTPNWYLNQQRLERAGLPLDRAPMLTRRPHS